MIEPTTTEPTTTYTLTKAVMPIGDIMFYTDDRKRFALMPLEDITPLESVRITTMLTWMTASRDMCCDWQGYVALHGLQRHFKEQ